MLARFCDYIGKVFDFWEWADALRDTRQRASLDTLSVWLSGWAGQVAGLGSLNALEIELRKPRRLEGLIGPDKPSADTIGRVYCRLELDGLREMLWHIASQAKRNKLLCTWQRDGLICVAIDGHELFASRHRHCRGCLQRRVKYKDRYVKEWYHRVVVCHVVNAVAPIVLDIEPVLPRQDEVAAAERLFDRLTRRLPRYFDVITLDALYAQASFVRKVWLAGKDIIVVFKDERRELMQDAQSIFAVQSPRQLQLQGRRCLIWDQEGFTSWEGLDVSVRVVRSLESRQVRQRIKGRWKTISVQGDWWWITTLPARQARTPTVWHFGHGRWDIENKVFNDLANRRSMDHCYKHDPTAILAFLLTLMIAFVRVKCFFARNLKKPARRNRTIISLRQEFHEHLDDPCCRSP